MSAIIVDSYRNITCASTKTCSIICAMSDELSWLQQWSSAHCDGEWEHGFGVTIATLDNPGWSVTIDVEGTQLASTPFESVKTAVSDTSWVRCHVAERKERAPGRPFASGRQFEGFGGALNLEDIIKIFRTWAETKR
jgi:hypothetical protein